MERRAFPRVRVNTRAVALLEGRQVDLLIQNAARGGLCARTTEDLLPGTELEVRLDSGAVRVPARVVSRRDGEVGLQFATAVDLLDILPPSADYRLFLDQHPNFERQMPWAFAFTFSLYLLARTYFRLQVKGKELIPYGSRFLWTHNHSGWVSLDAPLIGYLIARGNTVDRYDWSVSRMGWPALLGLLSSVEHGEWGITFWNKAVMNWPIIAQTIRAMHGVQASLLREPEKLREYRIFATPAEGEEGNCKSSFGELYKLQYFHTGPARLALEAELDYLLPVAIVGPEESFPNLGKYRGLKKSLGTILPVPLPVPPIPVQWVVRFLPPLDLTPYHRRYRRCGHTEEVKALCAEIMGQVKERIGAALQEELRGRQPFRPWFLGPRPDR
jgi:1-acyl-sn-glycerol-3-phosphate acyltransferase